MIDFLNCKIDISRGVLSPREETEFWAEKAVEEIYSFSTENPELEEIKVLDIFAGSGCIGIAVLKNVSESFVDFIDINEKALKQIQKNININEIKEVRFRIIQSDIFNNLNGKYHFILANPPYVALDRKLEVDEEVLEKEPGISLFAGKDGLDIIRIFLSKVGDYLFEKGKIYMEFDPLQMKEIERILKEKEFKFEFHKDKFDKFRFLTAQKNVD